MKRGQITIFVIIGIVIVVGGLIFIGINKIGDSSLGSGGEDVQDFIEECASSSLEKITFYTGLGGGYIFTPENSNSYGIPYYYNKGEILIINNEDLEEEMEYYFNQEMKLCLNEFEGFDDIKITADELSSKIKIEDTQVNLNLDFIVNIEKSETAYTLDKFNDITLSNNIGKINKLANEIIQEDISDQGLCLTCIYEKIKREDLNVDIFEMENDYVISITDEENKLNENVFAYIFAIEI